MHGYNIGDKLKVVKRIYGHGFKIGEIVTIKELDIDSFDDSLIIRASSDNPSRWDWSLGVDEVEKVDRTNDNPNWIFEPLKEEK